MLSGFYRGHVRNCRTRKGPYFVDRDCLQDGDKSTSFMTRFRPQILDDSYYTNCLKRVRSQNIFPTPMTKTFLTRYKKWYLQPQLSPGSDLVNKVISISNEAWRRVSKILEDILSSQSDASVRGVAASSCFKADTACPETLSARCSNMNKFVPHSQRPRIPRD